MLTRGQQIVVDVNDTVVIDCEFQETSDDRFNLFDNPVHWTKSQLDERSQINMMVNLIKPFSQVDQGRLRVSFAGTSPNYTMTLVIARTSNAATVRYFSLYHSGGSTLGSGGGHRPRQILPRPPANLFRVI